MSSLVELIFSALGTEQAATSVKGVTASLAGLQDTLGSTTQAGAGAEASFQKVQAMLQATAKAAETGGQKLAGLGKQIEEMSLSLRDQLDGSLDGTTKQLLAMGAAAVSLHAIYAGLKNALSEGDDFHALSLRTGESVRNLVVLDQAFRNAKMSQADIARSSNLLERALGGVNETGGKTEGAFRRLGTSIEQLKPLSYTEQLAQLAEGFSRLESPADRAAVAMQIFGRSGGQMLQLLGDPNAMKVAAQQAGEHADQVARDAEAFHQMEVRLNGVNTQMKTMWTGILEQLLPGLEKTVELLGKIDLGGLGSTLGAAGLESGGGLVALMGVDMLDRRLITVAEKFGGTMRGELAGMAAKSTGLLAEYLPAGLAGAISFQIGMGIGDAIAAYRLKAAMEPSKLVGEMVGPLDNEAHAITSPDQAAAVDDKVQAEIAKLEKEREALFHAFTNDTFKDGDSEKISAINESLKLLHQESDNFLNNAKLVGEVVAANQLKAIKASLALLEPMRGHMEEQHAKLVYSEQSPTEQKSTLATKLTGLEAQKTALPEGLSDQERSLKLLEIDNKILEVKKEQAGVEAKLTEESKKQEAAAHKQAEAQQHRDIYALETQMEVAKAANNEVLAQSLKEQIEQKRAAASLDGLDLEQVKQRIAAEHQIWVEQQAQKQAKDQITAERSALDDQLAELQAKLAKLTGDYTRTEAEKWGERQAELDDEIKKLTALVALEKKRADVARAHGDEPTALEHDKAARGFGKQLAATQDKKAQQGPNPDDWVEQSKKSLTELRKSWGTTAEQIAQSISGTIGGALNSVSQNITGVIMGTQSWAQALAKIGLAIETSIISAIVDMGVKYIATKIMMAVVGSSIDKSAQATSLAAQVPFALSESTLWAGPATLATIATFGGAAAAAPEAIGGAILATQGLALAETGGYFPGRDGEVAGIFHGNEFIFSAPAVRNLGAGNLAAMHQAALRPAGSSAAMGAGGGGGGGGGRDSARNTHIYLDRSAWLDAVHSDLTGIAHEVYDQRSRAA